MDILRDSVAIIDYVYLGIVLIFKKLHFDETTIQNSFDTVIDQIDQELFEPVFILRSSM